MKLRKMILILVALNNVPCSLPPSKMKVIMIIYSVFITGAFKKCCSNYCRKKIILVGACENLVVLLAVLFLPRLRNARYLWDHFVYRIKQDLAFCHIYSKIIETQFLPGKFTFDLIFLSFCHISPKMVPEEF